MTPRSGHVTVGGLVFFGRMLDKIRLRAEGKLSEDYNRGHGLNGRVCRFLRMDYAALITKALEEKDDEKVLE